MKAVQHRGMLAPQPFQEFSALIPGIRTSETITSNRSRAAPAARRRVFDPIACMPLRLRKVRTGAAQPSSSSHQQDRQSPVRERAPGRDGPFGAGVMGDASGVPHQSTANMGRGQARNARDPAAVVVHDPVTDRQPEAVPVPSGFVVKKGSKIFS